MAHLIREAMLRSSPTRVKLGVDDAERSTRALQGAEGKRLTYQRSYGKTA
jgi:hypothetical protein